MKNIILLFFILSIIAKLNAYDNFVLLDEQFKTLSEDFCEDFHDNINVDNLLKDVYEIKYNVCKEYNEEIQKHKKYIEEELELPTYKKNNIKLFL